MLNQKNYKAYSRFTLVSTDSLTKVYKSLFGVGVNSLMNIKITIETLSKQYAKLMLLLYRNNHTNI